jgi:hypothetical protein
MRAQVQPINPPSSCEVLRVKYLTSEKYREFKTSIQTRTDTLGAYITNTMTTDLQTAARNADPQVMYQSLVKYVRLEKSGSGYLYALHVQVFNEKGESIETKGQATASSVYSVNYAAQNAVTGREYFHTPYDPTGSSKWWQLELATPSRISKIILSQVPTDAKLVLQNGDKVLVQEFQIAQTVQEFTISLTQAASDLISQKMNELKTLERDVQSVLGCLQKEIVQRENISSDIYDLHQQMKEKNKQVITKDINVKSSKERAALLRDPYSETTVWESWFPLGRPLEKSSVPVLWTMALIFLVVSLGLFLYMAGFQLEVVNKFAEGTAERVSGATSKFTSMFKGPGPGTGTGPVPAAPVQAPPITK